MASRSTLLRLRVLALLALLAARRLCQVARSTCPVAGRPWAFWKAATALREFLPQLPSIIPGEKLIRSSRIWASAGGGGNGAG